VMRCRKLRDTLLFIRDECDWETPRGDFGGGGDERIGPAITAALDWPNWRMKTKAKTKRKDKQNEIQV
jgi:hypothetical protein